ncbi:MAG: hypothetical protein ACE5GF_09255, partial [Thermodesulfobacteriota bacterium]
MRNIFRWSVLVLLLLSSCAAKPHTVALQDALKVGDYENAYTILDKVCNENPEESVCGEMEEVRKRYGEVMISRLQGILDAEARPIPLARLAELNREVSEIGEMGLDEELTTVRETLIREEEDSRASAQESTREAVALFEKGMMREAFDRYKTALTLDGGIQKDFDTFKKMTLTELNRKGEEATEKDDWRTAHKAYQDAASIDVGYDNIEKRAKEAAERDSLDFYLAESDRAEKEGDYTRAVKLQKFALSYGETDELRTRFIEKSIRCTSELFNTVARQVDGEKPLSAGVTFLEAMELLSGVPEERRVEIVIPADRVTRLLDEFYVKGRKLKEEGRSELAYLYLRTLRGIQPNYPGVVEVMEALEGEIKNRAIKSLAVIPFKGPSYYVDAGAVLTSNILNFMHRELSRDVRILERGAIEDLLPESVVKTLQSGA